MRHTELGELGANSRAQPAGPWVSRLCLLALVDEVKLKSVWEKPVAAATFDVLYTVRVFLTLLLLVRNH